MTQSYQACSEGAVYWFNECAQPVSVVQVCTGGTICVDGACVVDECVPQVTESYKGCSNGTVYWFDDCDHLGQMLEACTGGATCVDGACVTDCQPMAAQYCLDNAITWYDSCDQPGFVVQYCLESQTCEGCSISDAPCTTTPECQDNVIDFDLTGSWWLVADTPFVEPCGWGGKTFPEQSLALTVNGSVATAVLEPPELFITLDFEGTLTGTQLTIAAPHTEEGPPSIGWASEHMHTIDATVTSATAFAGTYAWEVVHNNGDHCTHVWNITGTRQ